MRLFPRIILTVAAAAAVVAGVIAAGAWLREGLRERHFFSINDIECDPPAGRTREAFLGEVHYDGQLPERLNALDSDLPDRLKAAFAKHPMVERVDKIAVTAPNRVRVELTYRKSENR